MSFETPQSLLFRDAVPDDVAALTALARKTFTDKFGHLYNPDDLAAFLEETLKHSARDGGGDEAG